MTLFLSIPLLFISILFCGLANKLKIVSAHYLSKHRQHYAEAGEYTHDGIKMVLAHGAGPPGPERNALPNSTNERLESMLPDGGSDATFVLFGHSHVQFRRTINGREYLLRTRCVYNLFYRILLHNDTPISSGAGTSTLARSGRTALGNRLHATACKIHKNGDFMLGNDGVYLKCRLMVRFLDGVFEHRQVPFDVTPMVEAYDQCLELDDVGYLANDEFHAKNDAMMALILKDGAFNDELRYLKW